MASGPRPALRSRATIFVPGQAPGIPKVLSAPKKGTRGPQPQSQSKPQMQPPEKIMAEVCYIIPTFAATMSRDQSRTPEVALAVAREASAMSIEECKNLALPAYVIPMEKHALPTFSSAIALHIDLEPQYPPGLDWPIHASQRQQPRRKRRIPLKLACQLEELDSEDAACVLSVRKIHKLGFESKQLLMEHYSKFGVVERVLVSNSHEKAPPNPMFRIRLRPSGLGFVVMRRWEDAAAVLAEGDIQHVAGVAIEVREFMQRGDRPTETVKLNDDLDDDCSNSLSSDTRCPTDSSEL